MTDATIAPTANGTPFPAVRRPGHVAVGPLDVFDGGLAAAAGFVLDRLDAGVGARVATANLDFVARARRDAQLRDDLAHSDLVTADGAPVAWLARVSGAENIARVTGVDLVASLCERASDRPGGLRIALYGSSPQVAHTAAAELERRYCGVDVVAVICPPFGEQPPTDLDADLDALAAADPDVVLVALGCPRQERFIAQHFDRIPHAAWLGIGGTFDFYAGKRRRAPALVQRVGGEWIARLMQEPRRLWRRYFVDDLPALMAVAPSCLEARLRSRDFGTSPSSRRR